MVGTAVVHKTFDFREKGFASKLGRFLFKSRNFILVPIYLIMICLSLWELSGIVAWLIGPALICSGELLRLWAMQHIGRSARTRENKARRLVTTGPYVYTRNPLYVGNHVIILGFCVLSGLLWFAPIALGLCFLCYHFIVLYEEELLKQRFGGEYLRYKNKTPQWIPVMYLGKIFQPAWSDARRLERSTIRGLLIGMGLYVVKEFVFRILGF